MVVYNKLVRDKIPEIIRQSGRSCKVIELDDNEYIQCLNNKLQEELNEYYQSHEIAELVDIFEIIYAIVEQRKMSLEEFKQLRLSKRDERGGFSKKIFLIEVADSASV